MGNLLALLLSLVAPTDMGGALAQPAAQTPAPGPQAVPPLPPGVTPVAARVQIRGNRRLEAQAIRAALRTQPGRPVNQNSLREDVRALWRTGLFEDVRVELVPARPGRGFVVTFTLDEKPTAKRILIAGNEALSVEKINQVLDLGAGEIVDPTRLRRNAEKIRDLYVQRGHYVAQVMTDLHPVETDQVDVTFRIREGPRALVRRVNFVGNRAFSDGQLEEVVTTREPNLLTVVTSAGYFREDVVERDALLLQSHYLDRGYVNARVAPPRIELSADERDVTVTFAISEGKVYRLGLVDVSGDLLESRGAHIKRLRVKPGQVFNRSRLGQDIQDLTRAFKDRGYAYANVMPVTEVREKQDLVDLTLEVDKGPRVTVERINIRGNAKTRDRVIRRELRLAEGDTYSESRLDVSRRRVSALGFFRSVEITTKRGSTNERMVVTVEVKERPTGSFQVGIGFSSVESVLFQAQLSQSNLFGRGQALALQAAFSSFRRLFLLHFQDPYFLDSPFTFGFSAYNQVRAYSAFLRSSVGGTLTWGYQLGDDTRVFFTHMVEDVSLSTRGGGGLLGLSASGGTFRGRLANLLRAGITSAPQLSISHDTRDNRLFPRRGFYNTASAEIADRYTLSQNTFTRFEASARYFRPLWGPFLLRLRLEGGIITSRDRRGVPLFERFFAGGIFDVRGFFPRSLGPRIAVTQAGRPDTALVTFPIGGNVRAVSNNEIEFGIVDRLGIRGVVFLDGGNAFNWEDQYCGLVRPGADVSLDPCRGFSLEGLRFSWGFGLRWFSPIGPLRFEWGFPFRTLPNEEPLVFEFTIGNAF